MSFISGLFNILFYENFLSCLNMVISWNGVLLNYTFFRHKRFKNAWENSLYGHESNLLVIKISEEVYKEIKRDYLKN